MKKRKFLILDRDGTLIHHVHHLSHVDQVSIIEESIKGCLEFKARGFEFGMITNQSVIGLGIARKEDVDEINSLVKKRFRENNLDLKFMYLCPHTSLDMCDCRKPAPRLGLKAINNFNIDLDESFMVGDSESDMEFGYNLCMKTIFIGNKKVPTAFIVCNSLLHAAHQLFGIHQ